MIASTQTNQPFVTHASGELPAASYLEVALKKLRDAGLRITQSRIQLLSVLGRSREPLSVEELHSQVGGAGCDLVTIYRSMMVFEDHGLVQRCYRYNGTTVFEPKSADVPRYRVFCKESKQFEELSPDMTGQVREAIVDLERQLVEQGYSNVTHVLEFFAVSPSTHERRMIGRVQIPDYSNTL
jgi:Fur family ferric uptake transcriptional regulator